MDTKWSKLLAILVFAVLASQINTAALNYENGIDEPATAVDLGTALKMYYLAFQRIMPCGYPPLEIPILAPFTLDYYSFNFSNGFYSTSGNISNFMMTGLNDFQFLGFSYNATTYRITFDVIFPEIKILGECELDAMAYLAGFPAKMDNSGLLNMKLIDYRMVGGITLSPKAYNGTEILHISNFNMHFYIADALFNNWNDLWDISANNFANKFSREIVLMLSQQVQDQVDRLYAQLWLPVVNGLLSGVPMANILDFLIQETMELNEANCTL